MRKEIETLVRQNLVAPDRREIWEWAGGTPPNYDDANVDFGNAETFKGRFNVENVPWIREMLRAFNDPKVREITAVMPPQESGKTKGAEVCIAHRICTKPAKIAFNTSTNVKAKAWHDTRWQQMQVATPAIGGKQSDNPDDATKSRIVFADKTWLLIQGAETDSNRQGDSVEVQVNDEVHLWNRPELTQMHTRTRAYRETRKILNISLGADEGSELHERFLAGNQLEWCHHCPNCSKPIEYIFDTKNPGCNIRFDLSKAKLKADGGIDLREFAPTVRVACLACGHEMFWSDELLRKLNRNGVYIPRNPDASPEIVSIHVNAFAIGRRPWAEILEPWVRMHLKGGLFSGVILRTFICEDLAEFWKEKPITVSNELKLGDYTRADVIKPGSWRDEWIRLMILDNQRGSQGDIPHRWFVCRAVARDGRSRLVDCGRINEWSEVRARQLDLGVPDWSEQRPGPWVAVDRAHDPTTVDEVCAKFKWYGLLGQDTDEFVHGPESPFHGSRQLFSEQRRIDIGYGTAETGRQWACYYLWSSQKVQDLLAHLRNGDGPAFEVPRDIMDFCPEYAEHINSHRQVIETTKTGDEKRIWKKLSGWPDHLHDCESGFVVLGLMAGVFKRK